MRKFFMLTGVLWASLIMLCGITLAALRSQPLTDPLPMLQPCGSGWCFLKIRPGMTTWFEAEPALRAAAKGGEIEGADSFDSSVSAVLPKGDTLWLSLAADFQAIEYVQHTFDGLQLMTVGDLILKAGVPCSVFNSPSTGFTTLRYRDFSAAAISGSTIPNPILSPREPLSFFIYSTFQDCRILPNSGEHAWHGFGYYDLSSLNGR